MNPVTTALMRAIEMALTEAGPNGRDRNGFTELDKDRPLRDGFADAPAGTLYIELSPGAPTTRFLWAEMFEAGGQPPMTMITPGEGNGAAVLLSPEQVEVYAMGDGKEPNQFIAQLSTSEGKYPRWSFQRG